MGKGPKQTTTQNQTTTQDTTNKEQSEYAGGSGGGREDTATGHAETLAERQQRQEQEARTRGQQVTTAGGTQTGTQRGSTRNIYGTTEMPDTADMAAWRKALQEHQGQRDPTIQYRAANAKRDVAKMWQNPFGSATTPETREAMMRQVFSNIDQQAGQESLANAYDMGRDKLQTLGMMGELTRMKQPFRELLGTEQTGEQVGTTAQTGTTTSDQVSNTVSNLFGTDKQTSDNIQQQISDFFGYNFGQSSGESSGHAQGTSSGTSTTQQSQNVLGQILGGVGGAAASKL